MKRLEYLEEDIKRSFELKQDQLMVKIRRLQEDVVSALSSLKEGRRLNSCGVFQNTQMIEVLAGEYNTYKEMLEYIEKDKEFSKERNKK